MKLALLSDPNTENGQAAIKAVLTSIATTNKHPQLTIGYIASEPAPQREYFLQTQQMYQTLDATLSVYLELESGFSPSSLEALLNCDAIHLSGGDTYRFLKAMQQQKLLPILRQYAVNGGALIGVSAGAMLITSSIESAALCGDINHCQLTDFTALNLVDFMFAPHISPVRLESKSFKQQLSAFSQQICLCPDNASLVMISGAIEEIGHCHWSKS
ncbi:Type 1 glutamine amidotransferase-like domain-containing protein [Shewanella sp. 0m-8]